ncbi:hypothetical protein X551_04550 [Methylibium sp. T29]|nr:hypothetical protein X551_04550 [Methylibium sp. T29]
MLQLRRLGADHQPREVGIADGARIDLAGDLAAAQHRAVVTQRADLVELVADVEDGAAALGQLAQRDEQGLDGLRRQHRGRLVEDQQLGVGEQRAHDLDALALADRQRVHRPLRVDLETVDLGDLHDARRHLGQRQALVEAQPHVLGGGQRVEQAEVLVDHADPELARLRRARDLHLTAVPDHLAGVGPHRAVDDLHQRGLARPVLAQHRVDLPRRHTQVHAVVRADRRVLLGDAEEFEAEHGRGSECGDAQKWYSARIIGVRAVAPSPAPGVSVGLPNLFFQYS